MLEVSDEYFLKEHMVLGGGMSVIRITIQCNKTQAHVFQSPETMGMELRAWISGFTFLVCHYQALENMFSLVSLSLK